MPHAKLYKTQSSENITKRSREYGRFSSLPEACWWSLKHAIPSVKAADHEDQPSGNGPRRKVPKNTSAVCSCELHLAVDSLTTTTAAHRRRARPYRGATTRSRNEKKLSIKKVTTKEFVPKSILKKTAYTPGESKNKTKLIFPKGPDEVEVLHHCKDRCCAESEIEEYSSGDNDNDTAMTYVRRSFLSRLAESAELVAYHEPEVVCEPVLKESIKSIEEKIMPLVMKALPPGLIRQEAEVELRHYKPVHIPYYPYKGPASSYNLYGRLLQRRGSSSTISL